MDPGGFGPTSLGQLTGIHGECAAEGAKALHNSGTLQRANPSIKTRVRYIADMFHGVHGVENTVMAADVKANSMIAAADR